MFRKIMAVIAAAAGAACILASCGDKSDEKSSAKDSENEATQRLTLSEEQREEVSKMREELIEKTERLTISTQKATLSQEELDELRENIKERAEGIEYPTAVPAHSNKAFILRGHATSLFLENGWELIAGGEATGMQTETITSFPAILKYKDAADTITITAVDEVEPMEDFLKSTEEQYIQLYGSAYESIDITEFTQTEIDGHESFIIKADVSVAGVDFDMIHILSNDVGGKTYSWMYLGNHGDNSNLDLAEAVCYPKTVEWATRPNLEDFKRR